MFQWIKINRIRFRKIFSTDYSPVLPPWAAARWCGGVMHEAHRLALRRLWGLMPTTRWKVRLVLSSLLWPLTAVVKGWSRFRANAPEVKRHYGVGQLRQLLEIMFYANVYNMCVQQYYGFDMFLPGKMRGAGKYFLFHVNCLLSPLVNRIADNDRLVKKLEFHLDATRKGLPIVPLLASFKDGRTEYWFGDGPEALPRTDLFLKPSELWCGVGAESWKYHPDDDVWVRSGRSLRAEELLEYFRSVAGADRYVMQGTVQNRADIRARSGGGTCTVRLTTGLIDGEVRPLYAALRMPVHGNHVDNFSSGGLAAPIELGTGRLGMAKFKGRSRFFADHPDTGMPVAGFRIDGWDEIVGIGLEAHRQYPDVPYIGWDLVVEPEGTRILEANLTPGTDLGQEPFGRPLGETDFALCLNERLDRLRAELV